MLRTTSRLPAAAAAIAAATVVAACGSSSPSSGGHPTLAQMQQDGVRFSDCMRSHGVLGFPDPTDPHAFKAALNPDSGNARSPTFQSAYRACHRLLPNGGQSSQDVRSAAQIAGFLAFARCIRSHGFPTFPDPTSSGELTHQMVANAGINLHQPAVLQAGDTCVSITHGFITKADVARFVAGQ